MKKELLAGKKVLVMGLGRFGGGVDAAQFAHRCGAKVVITDLAPAEQLSNSVHQLDGYEGIEFHLGSHERADFEQADVVIANPAVPNDNEFLQIARRAGNCVTSQMNLFFELCPARIIGITGANGKSTTTSLTAHLLKNARHERVWLSGNIGNQPLLMTIDQIGSGDLVVLELSSFQLEQLSEIQKAPNVSLLTNLTANHLDRHGTFADYCAAKENIFKFQKLGKNSPSVSIFNAEDQIGAEWLRKYKKDKGRICVGFSADDVSEEIRRVYSLPGRANLSNLAAAMAVARQFGIDEEQIKKCLPQFKAMPHRLEFVDRINGVSWYNDSKATTPAGAMTALEAFNQPIVIIAGGYDKHIPFDELGEKIIEKAKAAILIGTTASKIAEAIENAASSATAGKRTKVEFADSFASAVERAHDLAAPGDVVLLSPACASYDMFENYEQRGRDFISLVKSLNTQKVHSS